VSVCVGFVFTEKGDVCPRYRLSAAGGWCSPAYPANLQFTWATGFRELSLYMLLVNGVI